METQRKTFITVKEEQLKEFYGTGLSIVQVIFPNSEYNPIFLAYKGEVDTREISDFIHNELHYNIDEFRIIAYGGKSRVFSKIKNILQRI